MITRYEFEILSALELNAIPVGSDREIADRLTISEAAFLGAIDNLKLHGFVVPGQNSRYTITEAGLSALEPYRVKHAVILAAGFGSRLMPATADRPKPMVSVNGVRIIDTLLDALVGVGIRDITVVGGYRFDVLKTLIKKYPFLRLIENRDYAVTNNISSAVLAGEFLKDGCYFCEADLYIRNPESVIKKYQYASNILGSYSMETDDWSYKMENGFLTDYRKGNTYCYTYYGISYWTSEDCGKLRQDFREVYEAPDGKDYFWEFVPFVLKKDRYRVEVRPCRKQDIMEIDSYKELAELDPSYCGRKVEC